MSISPVSFDNVEWLQVSVNGPGDANTLFIVSGVAIINFSGFNHSDDWNRDNCIFTVPFNPQGEPLIVEQFRRSVASAFPATIFNPGDETHGWGIDTVSSGVGPVHELTGDTVQVTARVVVAGEGPAVMLRMGFHVSILAKVTG
jgi:hypothetical protein